jgi:hypothetical protein
MPAGKTFAKPAFLRECIVVNFMPALPAACCPPLAYFREAR